MWYSVESRWEFFLIKRKETILTEIKFTTNTIKQKRENSFLISIAPTLPPSQIVSCSDFTSKNRHELEKFWERRWFSSNCLRVREIE